MLHFLFLNRLREDFSHTHSEVNCPHLSISGDYEISGQLMSIPVEEKGHFNAESGIIYCVYRQL